MLGWLYWYLWTVVIAIEAIAGATLLQAWVPLPTWQTGLGLMVAMTAVNLMSTRAFGEFEFLFASIKVAAIVVFLILALGFASGITSSAPTWTNLTAHGGFSPHGLWAVAAGVTTVFFSLTGAEIATVASAESREPAATVAKITRSLVGRILAFYVGSVFLIVAVVPWTNIVPGVSPFTTALEAMGFSWAKTAIGVVILTAVLSCLNSGFYVASRVLFALSAHRDAPAWLVTLDKRRVPMRAVLFGSVMATLGVAASVLSPSKVFSFLVNATGALILFVYIAVCLAYLRLRRTHESVWGGLGGKLQPFPAVVYAAIAGIGAVLTAMATTPELSSQFYASVVPFAVAVVAYLVVRQLRRMD